MLIRTLERFATLRRVPIKIFLLTGLTSGALLIGAIVMGQPLYIIALYMLLPWVPLLLIEGWWRIEHYNWLAIFAVVTILQIGHIGEHATQVTELFFLKGTLACPPPVDSNNRVELSGILFYENNVQNAIDRGLRPANQPATGLSASVIAMPDGKTGNFKKDAQGAPILGPAACGVFGQLDFETVHLVWDTLVWIGALLLLVRFPNNIWLWIAMGAASLHEIEHLFIGWLFFVETGQAFTYTRVLWGTVANGNIVTAYPVGVAHELTTFYEAGGKIGLMGQNGLIQTLLKITPPNFSEFPFAANVPYKDLVPLPIRPYLHFGYNSLVVLPTVIAFLVQVRRLYDVYLAKAFPKLSETQLIHVSAKLEHVTYAPGAIILRQDDSADKFCLIVKGQVEVVRRTPRGQEIGVTRLGEGQYFGEIGLMHGGKNIMTVRAATYVEVAELNRAAFQEFVGRSDLTKGELERMVRDRVLQIKALQAIG